MVRSHHWHILHSPGSNFKYGYCSFPSCAHFWSNVYEMKGTTYPQMCAVFYTYSENSCLYHSALHVHWATHLHKLTATWVSSTATYMKMHSMLQIAIANQASMDRDSCRKNAYRHPTLSPGVFTLFCMHGVCYGFEILKLCESPKHPFSIFKTRFWTPPKMIIYDNCYKLHAYCLANFQEHFGGNWLERACSKRSCLDSYKNKCREWSQGNHAQRHGWSISC